VGAERLMANVLDQLSPNEVGERLRVAREAVKVTQSAAAEHLGVARTTIVAIEKGQRRVRLQELQAFAALYKSSVNALLREEAAFIDMTPRFRKLGGRAEQEVEDAARLLNTLVRAEIELENLLGVRRAHAYPPERPLLPGDVRLQAEQDAAELRQWLGLGTAPVQDMAGLLEFQLGVRVFVRRLPSRISGLYAFDDVAGACMLINASHPRYRRTQTGAHETGHFTSTRHNPDVLDDDSPEGAREERYANAFARAFLTPARSVSQKFREVTAGAPRLTRRHIIVLAHIFGVSREAMVRRLEELGLTKIGTWDWFEANGGISDEQAVQVLGQQHVQDAEKTDADRPVSLRLSMLADQAWRRGLLSEGQLTRLLNLERIETRELLDSFNIEEGGADGAPELPL
jgi:Zn-dependent peptidase ImmA (M78 family)/DNA-binding XRE family transcriptional regulator